VFINRIQAEGDALSDKGLPPAGLRREGRDRESAAPARPRTRKPGNGCRTRGLHGRRARC